MKQTATRSSLPSGQLLDTSRAADYANPTAYEIAEILSALRLEFNMKSFEVLATDLSKLAHREKPWTKKYVHSVFKGHIKPSPEFAATVNKLAQTTDGTPAGVAGSVYVRVLADPTKISDGVLIPATAIVLKCARPGCPVRFVRIHPNQKFHDAQCRHHKDS